MYSLRRQDVYMGVVTAGECGSRLNAVRDVQRETMSSKDLARRETRQMAGDCID